MDAVGGGVVDVAALALRIAVWGLVRPAPRRVIIMDEPLRFLSEDRQESAARMLQLLAEKLELQIIMVTHEQMFISMADNTVPIRSRGACLIKDPPSRIIERRGDKE